MNWIWIFIAVVVIIVLYWILANTAVVQPPPPVADGDIARLVTDYQSYPQEIWFENNKALLNKYLGCKHYRYIIYSSSGSIVYDSKPDWPESAKQLRNSYEYINGITRTQAGAIRNNTINAAFLAKIGNRYRTVHVSEILFKTNDL